jgi:hypothetical protein
VPSNETVLRRILDDHYHHATGSIHAKAFANDTDPSTGIQTDRHSVSREIFTSASQLRSLAQDTNRFGVAAVVAEEYETMKQEVLYSPVTGNDGHCDAIGSKTAKVKDHLRKRATIRITPPQRSSGP